MTVAQKQRKWTVEEFFVWLESQEESYELIAGYPVLKRQPVPVSLPGQTAPTMMTGASQRHNTVNSNLSRVVGNQLRGGPCKAFANDAAVETGRDQIRYPDLVIDCLTRPDEGYILKHPKLIVEILSPSTKNFELVGKVTEYWQIQTLTYVLIIDPDQLRVQLHTRSGNGTPTLQAFDNQEDTIELPELDVTLKLSEIFEGLAPASDS